MTPFERQLHDLKEVAPGAEGRPLASGATLIMIPNVSLPSGWNATVTSIRFLAPVGYPFAAPDCFWADATLRLKSGTGMPQASNVQPIPETNENGLWFSWHVSTWNPNRDSLITYFNIIKTRLSKLE